MSKVIPDAISNYKELINCDAYYVDKTPHIKTILESTSKKNKKSTIIYKTTSFWKDFVLVNSQALFAT